MSCELENGPKLTLIRGGREDTSVRFKKVNIDVENLLLGPTKEGELPDPLPSDSLTVRSPERHERLTLQEVTLLHLKLELTNPFTTSFGTIKDRDVILVALKTADGAEGIGECPVNPNPDYNEESAQTVLTVLDKHLIPRLQGLRTLTNVEDLIAAYANIRGNFAAKAGVEAAYWDLLSRFLNVPLYKFWGGGQKHILTGVSVGGQSKEEVIDRVDRAVERGFPRIKVKIWQGFDVEVVDAVRSKYPDIPLQVDANSAYTIRDIEIFKEMDKYGLVLIEQPFSSYDLLDHARLQGQINTPVCLDESLRTFDSVRQAIELWSHIGKLNRLVVNIKPPRMGGYWEAVKIADLCQTVGVRAWCGGMLDTAWTKRMNIQLSSHLAFVLPGDHAQQGPYYREDIALPPTVMERGVISVLDSSQKPEYLDWDVIDRKKISSRTYSLES